MLPKRLVVVINSPRVTPPPTSIQIHPNSVVLWMNYDGEVCFSPSFWTKPRPNPDEANPHGAFCSMVPRWWRMDYMAQDWPPILG